MEKILIIDDDPATLQTFSLLLNNLRYKILLAEDGETGLTIFQDEQPDLVITDLRLPGINGIDVLKAVKEKNPITPVIIITGFEDLQSTISAMQYGAYEYLEKPLDLIRFKHMITKAIESNRLSERLSMSIAENEDMAGCNQIIGKTPAMKEIFKLIGKVSANRTNILITGESGTGKQLVAKVIHFSGVTKDEPFIVVNSSALPETLLESELFGHVQGAFTGAISDKKGKFELAGKGTILLDDISEISSNLQVKLLRVLQEKEFEKVGGEKVLPLEARIIAATNKNLADLVKDGKFREDLYYRLKILTLDIPPLRERKNDIPALVVFFLNKINKELHKHVVKIPYDVIEYLQSYKWIGNVRELENIIRQAVVLAHGDVLEREYITFMKNTIDVDSSDLSLASIEKFHIKYVLSYTHGDKKKAAQLLGISRQTLYNKLETYSIPKNFVKESV